MNPVKESLFSVLLDCNNETVVPILLQRMLEVEKLGSKGLAKETLLPRETLPDRYNLDDQKIDSNLKHEEVRLETFKNWPLTFLDPEVLARNGFHYLGRNDEVRCAFCKVELMRWEEFDDPANDHQRWAPQCPFLRNPATSGNVAINRTVTITGPAHPEYATKASRLCTFKDWPKSMSQKPEELAEAGFYYTGDSDKTKCFFCDGGLKDWESCDVPWEQHARWFDRCPYVQLVKGTDFVKEVLSKAYDVENIKTTRNTHNAKTALPASSKNSLYYILLLVLSNTLSVNCLELSQTFISQGAKFLNWALISMYSLSLRLISLCLRSKIWGAEDWQKISFALRTLGLLSSIASENQIGDWLRVWSFPRCNLSLLKIFFAAFL